MKKFLLTHPTGNQNSREAAKAFAEAGALEAFVTALNIPKSILNIARYSPRAYEELRRRDFSSISAPVVSGAAFAELSRLVACKLGIRSLVRHEVGPFSVDKIYRRVDAASAEIVRKSSSISDVYAYEDGAADLFSAAKRLGKRCVYELPIGYWREHMRIHQEEVGEAGAGWSQTWNSSIESQEKLERKDLEIGSADLIVVASSFTKKTLSAYPNSLPNVVVVPYGYPPACDMSARQWYSGARALKVLYVGGLSQRKGLSHAVRALQEFGDKVEFTVIGAGPGKDLILKSLPNCRYLGSISHDRVLEEMKRHDVLLFPSLFEGFGMVITEAMSQGMVVIATERTALPDIASSDSAVQVSAGSTDDIVSALEGLLASPTRVESMGRAALSQATSYQWSDYRGRLIEAVMTP